MKNLKRHKAWKQIPPELLLHRELLCFVRDSEPTLDEFQVRYGYHKEEIAVLIGQGAILLGNDLVQLNPARLSDDGKRFSWMNRIIHFDTDEVWIVCRGRPTHAKQGK